MLGAIQIYEPKSVAEASGILSRLGSDAAVYAGGTELLVLMKERLVHYPHLVNIKTIPDLDAIVVDGSVLRIGALATHRAIARSESVRRAAPLLAEVESVIANPRVREAGTLGGNLCFAEPHSDPATLLIAWDAVVKLQDGENVRTLPLSKFATGLLETVRKPNQILTAVEIPLPVPESSAYERFKTHERPSCTVATVIRLDGDVVADARIVVGSATERPARVPEAEQSLTGERPNPTSISEAARVAARLVEPTEDGFESVEYKRHLVGVLTERALTRAVDRANRSAP